jgi:putative pyoverdin transport system ATP-binding/permease protein
MARCRKRLHMSVVAFLLKEDFLRFVAACAASFASGLMGMGVLFVLFTLVQSQNGMEDAFWMFAAFAGVAVGARIVSRRLIGSIARDAILRLRIYLSRQIVSARVFDIERLGTTRIMLRLTDDIGRIAGALPDLVSLFANLTLLLLCFGYLGWLSPLRLFVTLAIVATGLSGHLLLRGARMKRVHVSYQNHYELTQAFRALVVGLKEIKLNAQRREQALAAFSKCAHAMRDSAKVQSLFFGSSATVLQLLFYIVLASAVIQIPGAQPVDRHILVSYGVATIYLIAPLSGVIQMLQGLAEANAAMNRVQELGLNLERIKSDADNMRPPLTGFRELRLDGVYHSYDSDGDSEVTLGPVDLTLAPGDLLFIIGGNGSGKTTLAKVLTGLYTPQAGKIYLDGGLITEANRSWYAQHFSAIFHDFFLFDRLLGQDKKEWQQLLSKLKIEDRLRIDDGLIVGASALSAGERKRVALMQAFLDDRPVYLFDEWAADQEPAFRDFFYNELLGMLLGHGKLIIVISHDDRYFHLADKILRLERGMPPSYQSRRIPVLDRA